jgi:hypothetical protein
VEQLAADRLGEAVDGVLGPAVRGLQGDRPVAERGAALDDRAPVAGPHAGQRRHRAVHEPQVAHLGDPAELLRLDLPERREHRGEGDVHPHVDRAEPVLRLPGRPLGAVLEKRRDQGVLGPEVPVERLVGQAGGGHDVGDPGPGAGAGLAHDLEGRVEQAPDLARVVRAAPGQRPLGDAR